MVLTLLGVSACTTLGPTPATTLVSAQPAGRPALDAQVAVVPGHYLSSAVVEEPRGAGIGQLAAVIDPDRLLGVPGLVLGGRLFGNDGDTPVEPMIGYRRAIEDGAAAIGGVVHGTISRATRDGARYDATRVGAEVMADVRLIGPSRWLELHGFGGLAVAALSADGTYCVRDDQRFARDCPDPGEPAAPMASAHASGMYPAAHAGLSADVLRGRESWFHGARVALLGAVGSMPRVESAEQQSATAYASIGFAFTLQVGEE